MHRYINWLKSNRINRKTFWFLDIFSLLIFFILGTLSLLKFPNNVFSYAIVIALLVILLLMRFILITLRSNDISLALRESLWRSGSAIIFGNMSLYFAPSNKVMESSFGDFEKMIFDDTKKLRLSLFVKNTVFYIILVIVISFIFYFLTQK